MLRGGRPRPGDGGAAAGVSSTRSANGAWLVDAVTETDEVTNERLVYTSRSRTGGELITVELDATVPTQPSAVVRDATGEVFSYRG